MKKSPRKFAALIIISLVLIFSVQVMAQKPIRRGPASTEEIAKARAVVTANIDSFKAHRSYIFAMGIDNPLVVSEYKAWMKKYPNNVNIPLAVGTVFYTNEMPQAREFLLKASSMTPGNAKVWSMLADDALCRGEQAQFREFLRKATLADTTNAGYAGAYLRTFRDDNAAEYKHKVYEFVKRFPESDYGAWVLCELAEATADLNVKIGYYEDLRKLYPPQKFGWSAAGMTALADIYLQTDLQKALILTDEMGDGKDWKLRRQIAESLISINKLQQEKNYPAAMLEFDKIKLPRYNDISDYIALKGASLLDESGNVKAAYDSLAVIFAKNPTDKLYTALTLYGEKSGKNKDQVDQEIEMIRNEAAVSAYPFDLDLYTGKGKLKLNDLKGKVVLLTFWFPGCNPCKAEFPHFEAVLKKINSENVAYVGINIAPEQDPYVTTLIKNNKYSFIPLHGNEAFAEKNYGVYAAPQNFLIDQDGKIIYKNFRINEKNHRTLELMILSLLKKSANRS
ncbi:TlpA disulfide reductase family protein [Chitinophaga sp. Cy-1792]|uniref:TlpA disulfide reductase family protein n=1 Tax=Chitinophaga sp. Cy-1792 TaxID=2608339 RepID=UPI0014212014|nr:TlpA disulfide reductase family protein [Chitinophaga sp. Cy-1792]